MRILVFWRRGSIQQRNTIIDHAYSFVRYDKENEYFYFDTYNGRYAADYAWIKDGMFDAVIFDYSVFEVRYNNARITEFTELMSNLWNEVSCVKIAIMQDDYSLTEKIWEFINRVGIDKVYTPIREEDHPIIYPKEKIGNIDIETVLTGYVEESIIDKIELLPHSKREYDVVYRASKLPYSHGKHGQLKYEIAKLFQEKLWKTTLKVDIENTLVRDKAILGGEWFAFLASSRLAIGCLGGRGFMDKDGIIADRVREYVRLYPDASFEETKANIFPDIDDYLHGAVSPRIFECAVTKTCQILVGNDYQGIMEPDKDYIMLKEDFSNIDDVVEKIYDVDYCENIAENCYLKTVKSGAYSYKGFVKMIIDDIRMRVKSPCKLEYDSEYILRMCKINNDNVYQEMLKNSK